MVRQCVTAALLCALAACGADGGESSDAAGLDAAAVADAAGAGCTGCPTVVIEGRQYTLGDLVIVPVTNPPVTVFEIWNVEDTCRSILTEPDPPAVPFPGEDLFLLLAGPVPAEGVQMATAASVHVDDGFQVREFDNQSNPSDWIKVSSTADGPLVEFYFTIQFELDPDTGQVTGTLDDPVIIEESMVAAPCF